MFYDLIGLNNYYDSNCIADLWLCRMAAAPSIHSQPFCAQEWFRCTVFVGDIRIIERKALNVRITVRNVGFRMISSEIYSKRNLIANDLRQFRYHTVDGARFCRRHVNISGVKAMIYFSSPANPINRFYWTMNRLNSNAEAELVVRHAGTWVIYVFLKLVILGNRRYVFEVLVFFDSEINK